MDRQTFHGFLVFGLKKLVDPNESFFRSLFAPHPETNPRHSAHSLRAREGNKVQFILKGIGRGVKYIRDVKLKHICSEAPESMI
ncbi:hypothetical protein R3W88_031823 [Solanum pinnatisectum]|uniref:Uncharacterized protein n=1 Tax=Solanum pinnatisectum TaxID=50273 RepID=A0AAV9LMF0_9SOLN|nr:hypothetical protein R3W88_031823 [Solanum pinnatisectum]